MDPKENAKTTEEQTEDIKKPLSDEDLDQVSGAGDGRDNHGPEHSGQFVPRMIGLITRQKNR